MSLFTRKVVRPSPTEELDLPALRQWASNVVRRVERLENARKAAVVLSEPDPLPTIPATATGILSTFQYNGTTRNVNITGLKRGRYGGTLVTGFEYWNERDGAHDFPQYKAFKTDLVWVA